jgi:Leucine-rich repeat (LRR) protein
MMKILIFLLIFLRSVFANVWVCDISEIFGIQDEYRCTLRFIGLRNKEDIFVIGDEHHQIPDINIKEVEFEASNISYIPSEIFFSFRDVRELNMRLVGLTEVSVDAFKDRITLKFLYLERNFVEMLEANAFASAVDLEIIELSINQIEYVHETAFSGLRKLHSLYLDQNQIRTLSEILFYTNDNLEKLYLQHNQIEFLPDKLFSRNLKLNEISLCNNKLLAFSNRIFRNLMKLNYLGLRNNPCVHKYYFDAISKFPLIEFDLLQCKVNNENNLMKEEIDKLKNSIQNLNEKFDNLNKKFDLILSKFD